MNVIGCSVASRHSNQIFVSPLKEGILYELENWKCTLSVVKLKSLQYDTSLTHQSLEWNKKLKKKPTDAEDKTYEALNIKKSEYIRFSLLARL